MATIFTNFLKLLSVGIVCAILTLCFFINTAHAESERGIVKKIRIDSQHADPYTRGSVSISLDTNKDGDIDRVVTSNIKAPWNDTLTCDGYYLTQDEINRLYLAKINQVETFFVVREAANCIVSIEF